eukprot:COSAG04_NODE_16552_length_495_cov_2.328283_2_plen_25_part_01
MCVRPGATVSDISVSGIWSTKSGGY